MEAGDSEQQGSSCRMAFMVLDVVSFDIASTALEVRVESGICSFGSPWLCDVELRDFSPVKVNILQPRKSQSQEWRQPKRLRKESLPSVP